MQGFSMGRKRSGFGVVAVGQLIYVVGGNDGENILSNVDVYNTLTQEWTKGEPMN